MTDEGASDTEKFVTKNEMRYAYAYDKGGKLARHFGVRGIPHAVLVDAAGRVVWKGHPGGLEEHSIREAVVGSLPKPLWEWPKAAKGVKNALLKGNLESAVKEASSLSPDDDGAQILASVQSMVKAKVDAMTAAHAKGDYLGAQEAAEALKKQLGDLPEAAEASKVLADIDADERAKEVIKGQEKLAKIRSKELKKKKDIASAIEDLRELAKAYSGTYVETEANELIANLGEMASGR